MSFYLRVLGIVAIILLAALAGWWLGGATYRPPPGPNTAAKAPEPAFVGTAPSDEAGGRAVAPVYFFAKGGRSADLDALGAEAAMAGKAGVHHYVLSTGAPWPGQPLEPEEVLAPITRIVEADPQAVFLLQVDLNPPEAWLTAHPDDTCQSAGKPEPYPALASPAWREDVRAAVLGVAEIVTSSEYIKRVHGCVLACLEKGRWRRSGGYDTSPANVAGFRAWLKRLYVDETALQAAWGQPGATFESAGIPEAPDRNDTHNVFFALPDERQQVDYLRYVSANTADAINELASYIKADGQDEITVMAPYGFSFEAIRNDSGQCALAEVLDGAVDGFMSPVSYHDRGLGGVGGFMGPADSALYHEKQWIIIDDTRTGITREPGTGTVSRTRGLRAVDVYSVQQRNFAAAFTHGLGLGWTDREAAGSLCDEDMWSRFAVMRQAYEGQWDEPGEAFDVASYRPTVLNVVVDELSRFHQRCDVPLNQNLLLGVRDAAMRASVPVRFSLLRDVLEEQGAPSAVYLFLNAFRLTDEERERLHLLLQRRSAAAIWMYAPGYIGETASADNISATTRIKVRAFDAPEQAGSAVELPGTWVDQGEHFGEAVEWSPLFYVDEPDTNILAKYRKSGKPSVAIEFLEEGWVSVYVGEPALSATFLREILRLLEEHIFLRPRKAGTLDVAHFGPDIIAVHAAEPGERVLNLGGTYSVQDMLQPESGWPNKEMLKISMKAGETRVLQLTAMPTTAEEY
jgi:hypothetical protein